MKIDKRVRGAVAVLIPHGPLTADEVDDFRTAVADARTQRARLVILNMSNVPYLDSAGIETVLDLCGQPSSATQPRLTNLGDACREALDLTDALAQLSVFDTVDSAVRSTRG
jgi:anti-anti-sigma factor